MNFYIGNLDLRVTENDLKEAFAQFGEVSSVTIIKNRFSGESQGYGFLEMPDNSDADKAIKALNGIAIKGRNIKITQQDPRNKRNKKKRRRF